MSATEAQVLGQMGARSRSVGACVSRPISVIVSMPGVGHVANTLRSRCSVTAWRVRCARAAIGLRLHCPSDECRRVRSPDGAPHPARHGQRYGHHRDGIKHRGLNRRHGGAQGRVSTMMPANLASRLPVVRGRRQLFVLRLTSTKTHPMIWRRPLPSSPSRSGPCRKPAPRRS